MKKSLFIAAALLSLTACTREMDVNLPAGDMTITARTETSADTKTIVEGETHVYWEPGDEIAVFSGDKSAKFTTDITESSATATFHGSLGKTNGADLWAVYPYSSDAVFDGEAITTTLPFEQVARYGSFGKDMNLSIAHSDNNNLQFYNVGGGIRFRLTQEGIKKVTFEGYGGEILTGTVKIGLDENGLPQIREVTDGSKVITLLPPSGNDSFPTNVWFYCVAIPGSLSSGYKLEFYRDTEYSRMASEKAVTIKRSIFGSIDNADEGCVFIPIPNTISIPDAVDLGLSVKWASFNVGASSPEEYGNYYAWGETTTKNEYSASTYKWEKQDPSNENYLYKLTKYCTQSTHGYGGFTDGKSVLDPEDDAAHVNLGDQWRMPLVGEIAELLDKCTWEWTVLNGVNGYKVTGPNNGSIFLPAAGEMSFSELLDAGTKGYYWSSSVLIDDPSYAGEFDFDSNEADVYWLIRREGCSVRAVYGDSNFIPVECVFLDKYEIEIAVGETVKLTATILPQNATNNTILWVSEDESVAIVSSGEVTGVAVGSTTIYAGSREGVFTTCQVTVREGSPSVSAPEAVDLGLSVKWGSFNLGATKPEEYGDYFAWGETEPKVYFNSETYKWNSGPGLSLTKYCTIDDIDLWGGAGEPDGKTVLDPEDDAAFVNLGGKWRMPTDAECRELLENCSWTWTTQNGVNGYLVSANNDHSIFLPAAGDKYDSNLIEVGVCGAFWSSSLNTDRSDCAYTRVFVSPEFSESFTPKDYFQRWKGLSVRPVYDEGTSVAPAAVPDPVDMGLSVKWASFNLGATKPEEFGDYYAWGETVPKREYMWGTYKWCNGSEDTLTKYCTDSSYGYDGFIDGKTVLDQDDDAAHVALGGKWRMPTKEEFEELGDNCSMSWTMENGINGYRFTSNMTGNSIFIPAGGAYYFDYGLVSSGISGFYWASSISESSPYNAWGMGFNSNLMHNVIYADHRPCGMSIRPVYAE